MTDNEKPINNSWSDQQENLIIRMVNKQGKYWHRIAKQLQNVCKISRPAKQIRERWDNHLNPDINKKNLTAQEQNILLELHQKYGDKWKSIAQKLSGKNQIPIEDSHIRQSRNESTLRKNLRQINQYMKESKSGEQKINIAKPSKFIKYFELVSGLQVQGFDVINSSQIKSLAKNVINFSRRNSNKKYSQLTIQEKKNFEELLKQMLTLRQVSENCNQNNQKIKNIKIERKDENQIQSYEQYQDSQQQQKQIQSQRNFQDSQNSQLVLNQKVSKVMDVDAKQSSQKNQLKQKKSIAINQQKLLIKFEENQNIKQSQLNQNMHLNILNNFIPKQEILLQNQQIGDVIKPNQENVYHKKQSSYQMSINLIRKINKLRSQLRYTPNKYLRSAYPSGPSYINSPQPYEVPPPHIISSQQHHIYDPMVYYPTPHPSHHAYDYSMYNGFGQIQDNESREGIKQQ